MSEPAFAFHGSNSASSSSQPEPSSSNSPAAADRTSAKSAAFCSAEKNGRPVRVYTAPPPRIPKRRYATSSSWHTSTTAREPMCFSWHTTDCTPAARNSANASSGCSR